VQSADNPGPGIVSAGKSAVVTFEARVNDGVPTGTRIINQGRITSNELPQGLPMPTACPQTATSRPWSSSCSAVALHNQGGIGGRWRNSRNRGQLEYVVRVNNIGSLPATRVVVTDNLNPPLGNQVTYVTGRAP